MIIGSLANHNSNLNKNVTKINVKTMVLHMWFESWSISHPSSAKQQYKMTQFFVFWRTWTAMANSSYHPLELNPDIACLA